MSRPDDLAAALTQVKLAERSLQEALYQAMKISGLDLRPMVRKTAVIMEDNLRTHDASRGIRGWANTNPEDILTFLHDELRELEEALSDGSPDVVWSAAADVANTAAMIADSFENQFVGEVHADADRLLGVTGGLDADSAISPDTSE